MKKAECFEIQMQGYETMRNENRFRNHPTPQKKLCATLFFFAFFQSRKLLAHERIECLIFRLKFASIRKEEPNNLLYKPQEKISSWHKLHGPRSNDNLFGWRDTQMTGE